MYAYHDFFADSMKDYMPHGIFAIDTIQGMPAVS